MSERKRNRAEFDGDILPGWKLVNVRRRAERARGGNTIGTIVTCPASRHLMLMADALAAGKSYPMFAEEPQHCAVSIYAVLESLWKARKEIRRLSQWLNTHTHTK